MSAELDAQIARTAAEIRPKPGRSTSGEPRSLKSATDDAGASLETVEGWLR